MKTILIAMLFMGVNQVYAQDLESQPERVTVPISTAYIPAGFDSNDRAQIYVEGYFPSTCYRVGPYEKQVNQQTSEVTVKQTAYKYGTQCLWMMVPYSQPVQVGLLKANNYNVKDSDSGRALGGLPIKLATSNAADDYNYAMISDAYVSVIDGNKRNIVIQGELPNVCWQLKEKRTFEDGKSVITVLPIIEKVSEENCTEVRVPFVTTVEVPAVQAGRYMLHVRSLSGASVSKLVDL